MSAPITAPPSIESSAAAQPQLNDEHIRPLVRELHKVNRSIYWCDLVISSGAGWTAFGFAVWGGLSLLGFVASVLAAVLCLYRSLCFVHELSHQSSRSLPGFEAAYNLLVGFPLLMPSFVYVGMHQHHHRVGIYGTDGDPEYQPFSRSWLMTTVFALESALLPVIFLVRFLGLSPVGFLVPRFHLWLTRNLSSLTMNPKYRRSACPSLLAKVRRDSAIIFCVWTSLLSFSAAGFLPWRWLGIWLLIDAAISFINTLRTLGAHAYESDGQPMDREAQLRDSIDTPGQFWTELWAPVGLRYHALHHYFPGVPYHNLPEAYRRIVHCLPVAPEYRKLSSPSLAFSLRQLLKRGWNGI